MNLTSPPPATSKRQKGISIYKYDADLAIAFQEDCEILLDKFSESRTSNFNEFCKIWKSMQFTGIFEGQQYLNMLAVFLQNCYFIAKKFLHTSDQYIQVGALYLLYGLYYKQPIKGWIKVRVIKEEFETIKAIVNYWKSLGRLEPLFIFTKMKLDDAFHYVAIPLPLGPNDKYVKRYDLSKFELFGSVKSQKMTEELRGYIEEDGKALKEIDDKYQALMKKFREICPELGTSNPSIIPTKLQQIQEQLSTNQVNNKPESDANQTKSRMQIIKDKAMKIENAEYRGMKRTITAADLTDSSDADDL